MIVHFELKFIFQNKVFLMLRMSFHDDEFAEKKVQTAFTLDCINRLNLFDCKIAPGSVETELNNHAEVVAALVLGSLKSQQGRFHEMWEPHEHILYFLMTLNKFTLVTHPVGYHLDEFSSRQESLENKTCFSDRLCHGEFGRGGNEHWYSWAILDWVNTNVGHRRRVALDLGVDPNQIVALNFGGPSWLKTTMLQ